MNNPEWHPKKPRIEDPEVCDLEQLARVSRAANRLELGSQTRAEVEAMLARRLGELKSTNDTNPFASSEDQGAKQLDLKLRQLALADAPWDQMRSMAWKRFRLLGTDEAAASLIESVFLHGSIHDLVDVLAVLNEETYDYYFHFDHKFREHLAYRLIKANKTETLKIFVADPELEEALLPLEHLYVYRLLETGGESTKSFIYFQQHETELVEAVAKYGTGLEFPLSAFYFEVASQAVAHGFAELAKRLLSNITPDQDEYGDALQLLMVLSHDPENPASQSHFQKLAQATNWRERVELIDQFLSDCRRRAKEEDIRRPAVNEIMGDPLKWVPAVAQAWTCLMKVVARHGDLYQVLPAFFQSMKDRALLFEVPALDHAFWNPIAEDLPILSPLHAYWRGVAKIHVFVSVGVEKDAVLWNARKSICEARDQWPFPLPFPWRELHLAAMNAVSKSPHIPEETRQKVLVQLKIAAETTDIALNEIEAYLETTSNPPFGVLENLEKISAEKNAKLLEKKIIASRASHSHLRNRDLDRLWHLACVLNDYDLAWRCATVVESRGALDERLAHPWSISGEKRSEYPFLAPTEEYLAYCAAGFSKEERKLVKACMVVGPLLPDLMAAIDETAKQVRIPAPATDSFEFLIEKALNEVRFLPAPRKYFRFGNDGLLSASLQLPGFIQVMPNNAWSFLYLKIAERLGLHSWGWKLTQLHERVEKLLPRLTHGEVLDQRSVKIAKWLKALTLEQRTSWNDLVNLHAKMNDETGMMLLAKFVGRLTILIHPAHVQALKSLRTMRAPVGMIWDLERWIVSEEYSNMRKTSHIVNRVMVPLNVRSFDRISVSSANR